MTTQTVRSTGISAHRGKADLSDFGAHLDEIQELGAETVELPTYDLDIVAGGRINRPQLERLKRATADRGVIFTAHGPLAINFFDEPLRLARHFDVLRASIEAAAELEAVTYVMHTGVARIQQAAGIEERYLRQREWLAKAGEFAEPHGLTICVENLFGAFDGGEYTATPARLAREIAAIDHPCVRATLDFSHAYLHVGFRGGDFLAECAALAPLASHLHVHDSFGLADDIWMFTDGERLAFGHGDLHLPVGWGSIPWDDLMAGCRFPSGTIFNIELNERYWHEAGDCIARVKDLARMEPRPLAAAAE